MTVMYSTITAVTGYGDMRPGSDTHSQTKHRSRFYQWLQCVCAFHFLVRLLLSAMIDEDQWSNRKPQLTYCLPAWLSVCVCAWMTVKTVCVCFSIGKHAYIHKHVHTYTKNEFLLKAVCNFLSKYSLLVSLYCGLGCKNSTYCNRGSQTFDLNWTSLTSYHGLKYTNIKSIKKTQQLLQKPLCLAMVAVLSYFSIVLKERKYYWQTLNWYHEVILRPPHLLFLNPKYIIITSQTMKQLIHNWIKKLPNNSFSKWGVRIV